MYPAYLGGLIVGATIGALIVGGLLGWAIHKAARLDYRIADAIGVLLVPVVAIFGTAVERQGPVVAVTVYGLAALIAYFLLRLLRRWMRSPGSRKAGEE
ncbi:hypothetical protein [Devosia sp. A16]|uniref:hypothetical protein n=1 Tax=Devosia sp. A16 TaxID=1736675 RepID=UPI0006D845A7|nr:hypothetical protein [Devosia sp. A16]